MSLESTGDRLGTPAQPEGREGFLEEAAHELRPAGLRRVDEQDRIDVRFRACPPCPAPGVSRPQWRNLGAGARAMESRELACALTNASWTLAGAAGPRPSDWRDLRGEGRCRPAPFHSAFPLGLSQSSWKPLPSGEPPTQNLYLKPMLPPNPKATCPAPEHAPGLPDTHTRLHCLLLGPEGGGPGCHGRDRGEGQGRNWGEAVAPQGGSTPHLIVPETEALTSPNRADFGLSPADLPALSSP